MDSGPGDVVKLCEKWWNL